MNPALNALNNGVSSPIAALAADAQAAAERLAALPSVAGVQVAGVVDGSLDVGAAGVADAETSEPVTVGTGFRIGSITKLLTAHLVMRCVLDGRLGLDDPLTRFVPGPWDGVLVRHLLSHSTGLDAGDIFVDTGNEDDAIARYTEMLRGVGSLFSPGATFSYCNGGVILAGRLVEVVLGRTWREALREEVLDAAGMCETRFVTGVDAGHDLGTARGHAVRGGELAALPRRIDHPMCTRGLDPAGGTVVSTAADLGRFTLAHLRTPGTDVACAGPGRRGHHARGRARLNDLGQRRPVQRAGRRRQPRPVRPDRRRPHHPDRRRRAHQLRPRGQRRQRTP
ncbi:serine hydrolase domain-containing protein [Streptomyces sp. ESR1.13]|uniref:serine hydrolase domain-containing protein n=1 Tax=unclassified Streptomyces TaxID=2593676 RepID=UPI0040420F0A